MAAEPPLASEILRLRAQLAAERVSLVLARYALELERKENRFLIDGLRRATAIIRQSMGLSTGELKALHPHYDPDQPRVPRGNPNGGEWTRVAGPEAGGGPSDEPPKIPTVKPPTAKERNAFVKAAAQWLARAGRVAAPIGAFLNVMEGLSWLDTDRPFIDAYQDPPKTLDELQTDVFVPKSGYHWHHIVEQTSAEQDGFPRGLIDNQDNLVRIPALKHWEITGWYMHKNKTLGGLSPREFLREKSWEERREFGLKVLIDKGVLKP